MSDFKRIFFPNCIRCEKFIPLKFKFMINFFLLFACFTHAKMNKTKRGKKSIAFFRRKPLHTKNDLNKTKKLEKQGKNYHFAQWGRVQLFVISLKWFNDEVSNDESLR